MTLGDHYKKKKKTIPLSFVPFLRRVRREAIILAFISQQLGYEYKVFMLNLAATEYACAKEILRNGATNHSDRNLDRNLDYVTKF